MGDSPSNKAYQKSRYHQYTHLPAKTRHMSTTPLRKAHLENSSARKEIPRFYRTRRFITVLTKAICSETHEPGGHFKALFKKKTHFNIISPHTLRLVTGLFHPPTFLSHIPSPPCYLHANSSTDSLSI